MPPFAPTGKFQGHSESNSDDGLPLNPVMLTSYASPVAATSAVEDTTGNNDKNVEHSPPERRDSLLSSGEDRRTAMMILENFVSSFGSRLITSNSDLEESPPASASSSSPDQSAAPPTVSTEGTEVRGEHAPHQSGEVGNIVEGKAETPMLRPRFEKPVLAREVEGRGRSFFLGLTSRPRSKSMPSQKATFFGIGRENGTKSILGEMPHSLEGTLSYRKGNPSMLSRPWKQGYVVLTFADGGTISCYKKKPAPQFHASGAKSCTSLEDRPQLQIPFNVGWIGKDVKHDSTTFVVEVDSSIDITRFAGGDPGDNAANGQGPRGSIPGKNMSLEVAKGMQTDLERAKHKGKPLRIYFRCIRGTKEKLLWLAAFTRLGRLSKDIHRKKGFIASFQPNIQLSHSRTRKRTCEFLARESRALHREDSATSFDSRTQLQTKRGNASNKEYLVYPMYAYPNQWMTHRELKKEMVKNSAKFHDLRRPAAQDKQIGTLTVEVLECIGLPKLDLGSETDAVVYLVCGPFSFATDVIWNRLNPIWLPKSRRACIFPLFHAYARLFVGVFDDDGKNEKDDFAGRVVVDLARCRTQSRYDVTLPLRLSSHVYSRRPRGAIRIRFTVDWKSERDALLSYIPRKIRAPTLCRPDEDVTVMCADEKAFRNIAFTVHGIHMPGRFSFQQWRATLREVNLIRKVSIMTLRITIVETIQWKNPALSLFVFSAWMHCVYANSFALVPAYLACLLLLVMFRNYLIFGTDGPLQDGFIPPSWEELFRALVRPGDSNSIAPLELNPHESRRVSFSEITNDIPRTVSNEKPRRRWLRRLLGIQDEEDPGAPDDYQMEFPFSRGLHYPKFTVEESLVRHAPKSTKKGFKDADSVDFDDVISVKSQGHGNALGPRTEADINLFDDGEKTSVHKFMAEIGRKELQKRFSPSSRHTATLEATSEDIPKWKIIPEQNIDVEVSKKKKLSDDLVEVRDNMHRLTFHLFNDRTHIIKHPNACYFGQAYKSNAYRRTDVSHDLDRLLNVGQYSSANPVVARVGMYVEPIISATHSGICLARALYNIATWRDPFLSFWVSLILIAITCLLFVFPWRICLFVVGTVIMGPQNWALRVLEEQGRYPESLRASAIAQRFKRKGKNAGNERKRVANPEVLPRDQPIMSSHSSCGSPPLKVHHGMVDPREIHHVSVPYSQVMYQRFYDWPPEAQYARVERHDKLDLEPPELESSDVEDEVRKSSMRRRNSFF